MFITTRLGGVLLKNKTRALQQFLLLVFFMHVMFKYIIFNSLCNNLFIRKYYNL